jgi:hypothetical protein
MAFGLLNLAQTAISAAPLFFGENNIFSGKARRATKELRNTFQRSQDMQLPSEYNEAMQNLRTQASVGLPSSTLGLYKQQADRQQASQLGALGSRRSALAGIGGIAQAGQDASLRLASMQGQAMQEGQQRLNQGLMQMGGLKRAEELRKIDEAKDYWGTQKAEVNKSISSSLAAVGSSLGTSLTGDMYAGEGQKGLGLSKIFKGRLTGQGVGAANAMANVMKSGRKVF